MFFSANQNEKEKNGELIWSSNGFFRISKQISTCQKKNLTENTLVYINQGTISTIKSELAIYVNCVILGQIILALDTPKDTDSCQC